MHTLLLLYGHQLFTATTVVGKWYERRKKEKREAKRTFPTGYKHTPYWCEGHWAPYRVANGDGIYPNNVLASAMITQEFLNSAEYMELANKSPEALNKHMRAAEKPLCCRLGEEVMSQILAEAIKCGTRKERS